MKFVLVAIALVVLFAIVAPLLHLVLAAAVFVAAVIVVMAAWKVLFGAATVSAGRGGPPAVN